MQDANTVTDATDWVDTNINELQPVDNALRCQVCKEFFDTPVITSCAHTFCSLCIRRCLTHDGKCPTCRAEDQPIRLRRNWVVEEVVNAFVKARPSILRVGRELAASKEYQHQEHRSVKRKLKDLSVGNDTGEEDGQEAASLGRKTRSQSRRANVSKSPSIYEVSDGDTDSRFASTERDDGKVECPICHVRMKEHEVSPHMDRDCLAATPSRKSATQNAPMFGLRPQGVSIATVRGGQERLSQLNYSLLSDTSLRKKLTALSIPSTGNKQAMVRRHKEWVDLYNANYDSSRPRTKRELLKDLDTWERTQGALGRTNEDSRGIMSKDFDGNAWAQKNDSNFKNLIAQARAKRATPPNSSEATTKSSEPSSTEVLEQNVEGVDNAISVNQLEKEHTTPADGGTVT